MSDVRGVLENIGRQVTAGPDAFDRLVRRQRRRRAQRRVATAALALALSALAVGGVIHVFEADRQLPADRIDRRSIHELRPAWQSSLGSSAAGHEVGGHHEHNVAVEPFAPVAAGRSVVVLTADGRLMAFPSTCRTDPCAPRWTASVPDAATAPVAVGETVLVLTANGRIEAFTSCPADGGTCQPTWVSRLSPDGAGPAGPAVVADGFVYGVATDGTVFAFDGACRAADGACGPAWTASMTTSAAVDHQTTPMVDDGLLFATNDLDRVYAFDLATGETRWVARIERPEGGWPLPDTLAVEGERVFATFSNTLYAFPVDCEIRCIPDWHADAPGADAIMSAPVADAGEVFVKTWSSGVSGHTLAFTPDCGANGRACTPTWSTIDHGWGDVIAANGIVYSTAYVNQSITAYPSSCSSDAECVPMWEVRNVGTPVSGPTLPITSNGLLFVPTESGTLQVFPESCDPACRPVRTFAPTMTGRERVRSLSPPLISDGRMWFVSADGRVFAYALTR